MGDDDDEPQDAGKYAEAFKEGLALFKRGDDDAYDRLNSRFTVCILVLIAGFIMLDTLTKEPIVCYAPAQYTDQWTKYTDNVCWVQNTYADIVLGGGWSQSQQDELLEIPYYQWVPIILLVQSIFFIIPGLFWSWAVEASGYDLQVFSKKYRDDEGLEMPEDERNFIVDRIFISTVPLQPKDRRCYGKGLLAKDLYFGRFLTVSYGITKLFYVINAALQFEFLNVVLGDRFATYGYDVVKDWMDKNATGVGAALFPKVTFCRFDVREPVTGVIQQAVTECLLPRNLFYERAFAFLWWWFAFVVSATAIGMLRWLLKNFLPGTKARFVWNYLRSVSRVDSTDRALVKKFAEDGLRSDGILCLKVILRNSNDMTTAQIVTDVWGKWHQQGDHEHEH